MLEYTKQPLPVAWTSRIRPPVPVAAPGNGLTPKREKFYLHQNKYDLLESYEFQLYKLCGEVTS